MKKFILRTFCLILPLLMSLTAGRFGKLSNKLRTLLVQDTISVGDTSVPPRHKEQQ